MSSLEYHLIEVEKELEFVGKQLGSGYSLARGLLWDAAACIPWSVVAVSVVQVAVQFLCSQDQKLDLALWRKGAMAVAGHQQQEHLLGSPRWTAG